MYKVRPDFGDIKITRSVDQIHPDHLNPEKKILDMLSNYDNFEEMLELEDKFLFTRQAIS